MFVRQCNVCHRFVFVNMGTFLNDEPTALDLFLYNLTLSRFWATDEPVKTVGQKLVGQACFGQRDSGRPCRGKLRDNILDWEDRLPDRDMQVAQAHSLYDQFLSFISFLSYSIPHVVILSSFTHLHGAGLPS